MYIGGAGLARGYLNRPDITRNDLLLTPLASKANFISLVI
jgi:non-ribosomal peptide synthetase component F